MATKTCLVTGVAGFVGSHLAERLIEAGHDVVGVDCFTDFYPRRIKQQNLVKLRSHDRFHFIEGDLLDLDLPALLHGRFDSNIASGSARGRNGPRAPADVVFHLAAQAGVRDSWGKSFDVYARNNVLATQQLLEAARGAPISKIVVASSSSIYGDAEAFPTNEDVVPQPVSPYGVTKLAAENLAFLYWRTQRVRTVSLRYFTVYGPRQRPDMAFHRFIRAVLAGQEIEILGDGEQTRDFTYVADTVDATIRAGFSDAVGTVFNVGGGSRVSVNEVIHMIEGILNRSARVRYSQTGEGDVRHTSADMRRADQVLGYRPEVSLREGLFREAAWLRDFLETRNEILDAEMENL